MELLGTHRAIATVIAAWMTICSFAPISSKLLLAEATAQQRTQVVRYSNTWAVEVHGGAEEADMLAQKHGLINRGQVNLSHRYNQIPQTTFLLSIADW